MESREKEDDIILLIMCIVAMWLVSCMGIDIILPKLCTIKNSLK